MFLQKTFEKFDVLLVDRGDRSKVYITSRTEPQPKKIDVREYLGIAEGLCFRSSLSYPNFTSIIWKKKGEYHG